VRRGRGRRSVDGSWRPSCAFRPSCPFATRRTHSGNEYGVPVFQPGPGPRVGARCRVPAEVMGGNCGGGTCPSRSTGVNVAMIVDGTNPNPNVGAGLRPGRRVDAGRHFQGGTCPSRGSEVNRPGGGYGMELRIPLCGQSGTGNRTVFPKQL
jgi:hypothetical protein